MRFDTGIPCNHQDNYKHRKPKHTMINTRYPVLNNRKPEFLREATLYFSSKTASRQHHRKTNYSISVVLPLFRRPCLLSLQLQSRRMRIGFKILLDWSFRRIKKWKLSIFQSLWKYLLLIILKSKQRDTEIQVLHILEQNDIIT